MLSANWEKWNDSSVFCQHNLSSLSSCSPHLAGSKYKERHTLSNSASGTPTVIVDHLNSVLPIHNRRGASSKARATPLSTIPNPDSPFHDDKQRLEHLKIGSFAHVTADVVENVAVGTTPLHTTDDERPAQKAKTAMMEDHEPCAV